MQLEENRSETMQLNALGASVPSLIWVDWYVNNPSCQFNLNLAGASFSPRLALGKIDHGNVSSELRWVGGPWPSFKNISDPPSMRVGQRSFRQTSHRSVLNKNMGRESQFPRDFLSPSEHAHLAEWSTCETKQNCAFSFEYRCLNFTLRAQ